MLKIKQILVLDDETNTVSDLHLNWTSKHPKTPGFYFYKYPNSNDITVINIFFEEDHQTSIPKIFYSLGIENSLILSEIKGTFYGPLPEP